MKKFVVSLCVIACVIWIAGCAWGVPVRLDAEHFPDPVFRSWMTQWDYGWPEYTSWYEYTVGANDGILSDIEIARIMALNPVGSSLKGIEYLWGLKILTCRYLNLTELDVSENSGLNFLNCELNKLKKLDVNNNLKLKTLICNSNDLCELDLSNNTSLAQVSCYGQKREDLKITKTSEGYEVNMRDYDVSHPENIDADSISPQPVSYNKETGIITFSEPVTTLRYNYITHSPNNDLMDVTITKPMSIVALERSGSNTDDLIIHDMTDNSYLDRNGNQLTESAIQNYSYGDYGKLGLAADGNSRLILRVQTSQPGTVSFSFKDDIGANLESLSRRELSPSEQLSTTEMNSDIHQVSAVLVAPETFPKDKNFPSDTFKVHVKFTDEDGEITEDDLELKIEAAPVVLIHGFGAKAKASNTFIDDKGHGIMPVLKKAGFNVYTWDYDGTQGPSIVLAGEDNELSEKIDKIFNDYAKKKIICTRVDLVGYSMGGLMTRQFCLSEANKKSISYKQGMVRRIVTVATPHRGSPWSEVFYKYSAVADTVMQYMFGYCPTAWKDMRTGSTVTSANFPENVPMHSVYGLTGVNLDQILPIINSIDDILYDTDLAFKFSERFKKTGGLERFLLVMKFLSDLRLVSANTVLKELFGDEDHDFCVSQSSAAGDFSYACTDRKDWWKYNHLNICKQDDIGEKILLLLKYGKSDFKTFGSSLSPVNAAPIPKAEDINSAADTSDCTIENPFTITVTPEVLNVHDTGKVKIKAVSNVDIDKQLYMSISMNGIDTIFAAASKDTKTFEVSVEFTSQDTGLMEVSCLSYNTDDTDKIKFYISDTAHVLVAADLDNVNITSIDFAADSVYTSVNSETPAGLYAVDSDGRYYDVSSPLNGTEWTSTEIARVNDNGCILGLKEGSTTLTAKFRGLTASVNVEVSAALVEEENIPPEIKTETLAKGVTGQPYSLQLTASGATPITWTHKGSFPKGLTLNSDGLISGTPIKAGKSSFTVTAKNSYGKSSRKFKINVLEPVSITTASLKAGTITKSYSVSMKAKGTKTITWSAKGLPNGLSINEKGKISGKPTVYGNFTVKITAQNEAGSITKSFPLEIKAIAPKLSGSLAKPTLNQPYSSSLKVTGSTPIIWSVEGILPDGLTLDSSTGIISGTPTSYAKSGYKLTITATNDAGKKSKKITLKVNGKAPKITAKLPKATAGENYSAELSATGSDTITFAADLPEYLTLDGDTITGNIPEATKNFKIKVYASNPVKTVSKTYTIKVSTKKVSSNKKATPEILKTENSTGIMDNGIDIMENNTSTNTEVIADMQTNSENDSEYNSRYVVAVELGEVSCDLPGMYDFNVELPDYIAEGSALVYAANSDSPSEDDSIAEFYDDAGNEISAVPENRRITISIWLNPETTYNPVIAVKH